MSILQSKEGIIISIYIAESVGVRALALSLAEGCSALLPATHGSSKKVGTSESNSIHPNLWFIIVPEKVSPAQSVGQRLYIVPLGYFIVILGLLDLLGTY